GPHPDMPALQVLASIMDAEQTGRLYKALVENQMATQVSASADSLFDPGLISFSAEVRTDKPLEAVRTTLIGVVEKVASGEFTDEEVDRVRNAYEKNFEQTIANSGRVGITLSE